MQVRVLPSCPAAPDQLYLTSFVIDGRVAIDAGALGVAGEPGDYSQVATVFVTHSHLDHVASLPLHIEERVDGGHGKVTIYGHAHTIASLREDLFNDRLWPDLVRLGGDDWIDLIAIEAEKPVSIDGTTFTPVLVDHTVPSFGYVVDDGRSVVAFGADSGPTDRIWEVAAATGRLRGAFLEASFPDRLAEHAATTRHLTPRLLAAEVAKLPGHVHVVAVHIKPAYRREVVAELEALELGRLSIGTSEDVYDL